MESPYLPSHTYSDGVHITFFLLFFSILFFSLLGYLLLPLTKYSLYSVLEIYFLIPLGLFTHWMFRFLFNFSKQSSKFPPKYCF